MVPIHRAILFSFLLAWVPSGYSRERKLDPALKELLKKDTESSRYDVLVTFKGGIEKGLSEAEASVGQDASPKERHEQIYLFLTHYVKEITAEVTEVLANFKDESGRPPFEHFTPYWTSSRLLIRTAIAPVIQKLEEDPSVEWIENAPIFEIEEGRNTEPQISDNFAYLYLEKAQKHATGEGVTVGIIDTGVRATHKQLELTFAGDYGWMDGINIGSDKGPMDSSPIGHGTMIAGIISGTDPAKPAGIAPKSTWAACKACNEAGKCELEWVMNCISWAGCPTLPDGGKPKCSKAPQVLYFGVGGNSPVFMDDLKTLNSLDITIVAPSGGDGPSCNSIWYPAKAPFVIGVGGVYESKKSVLKPLPLSGIGPGSAGGIKPDVVSMATHVGPGNGGNEEMIVLQGTYVAAAQVAGVVALLLSRHPELSSTAAQSYIKRGANPSKITADKDAVWCSMIDVGATPNVLTGHGLVNAWKSLQALTGPVATTFYQDTGYAKTPDGKPWTVNVTDTCYNFKEGNAGMILSLEILSGCVELFASPNCEMLLGPMEKNIPTLGPWNNKAMSVKTCGEKVESKHVVVFEEPGYQGKGAVIEYTSGCSQVKRVNSLVFLRPGCVELYTSENCTGSIKMGVTSNLPVLGQSWSGNVRSLSECTCPPASLEKDLVFFDEPNYEGKNVMIKLSENCTTISGQLEFVIKSVLLVQDICIDLYLKDACMGDSIEICGSVADIHDLTGDEIHSIVVSPPHVDVTPKTPPGFPPGSPGSPGSPGGPGGPGGRPGLPGPDTGSTNIFHDRFFQGASIYVDISEKCYNLPPIMSLEMSSMYLPPGECAQFHHHPNCQGLGVRIDQTMPRLGFFDNKFASVQRCTPETTEKYVMFMDEKYYKGKELVTCLHKPCTNLDRMEKRIKSIHFYYRHCITIYSEPDCKGESINIEQNTEDLGDFNDKTMAFSLCSPKSPMKPVKPVSTTLVERTHDGTTRVIRLTVTEKCWDFRPDWSYSLGSLEMKSGCIEMYRADKCADELPCIFERTVPAVGPWGNYVKSVRVCNPKNKKKPLWVIFFDEVEFQGNSPTFPIMDHPDPDDQCINLKNDHEDFTKKAKSIVLFRMVCVTIWSELNCKGDMRNIDMHVPDVGELWYNKIHSYSECEGDESSEGKKPQKESGKNKGSKGSSGGGMGQHGNEDVGESLEVLVKRAPSNVTIISV